MIVHSSVDRQCGLSAIHHSRTHAPEMVVATTNRPHSGCTSALAVANPHSVGHA